LPINPSFNTDALLAAFDDSADRAAIRLKTEDKAKVAEFVGQDPYVKYGLVESWRICRWTVVLGSAMQKSLLARRWRLLSLNVGPHTVRCRCRLPNAGVVSLCSRYGGPDVRSC
jgi:hypothetical protein